jgi:uncharacterized membrane protein
MTAFAKWLENTSWVTTLTNSQWMYSVCEISHYFSLFVAIGTIVIVDLRILGLAGRRQPAAQLAKELFPWAWKALCVVILSGFLMYTTDAVDYAHNRVFYAKLSAMLLAILASLVVQRNAAKWDVLPTMPHVAKLVALVSLLLWIGTIVMAVEIPALTGVG